MDIKKKIHCFIWILSNMWDMSFQFDYMNLIYAHFDHLWPREKILTVNMSKATRLANTPDHVLKRCASQLADVIS